MSAGRALSSRGCRHTFARVGQYLGALPDLGRVENWRDLGIDPPAGAIETTVYKGLEPQSRTQIIFAGAAEYSIDEANAISAMADVLDIELRKVLREDLGGTDGVGVGGSLSYRPDEEYSFVVSFGSDSERAEELSAAVFEEIERPKAEGPDPETVDKGPRDAAADEGDEPGERLLAVATGRLRASRAGPEHDPELRVDGGWTAEQVQQAAIRYLRMDQYARFVLLPEQPVP